MTPRENENKKSKVCVDLNTQFENLHIENGNNEVKVFSFTPKKTEEQSSTDDVDPLHHPDTSSPPSTNSKKTFNRDLIRLNVAGTHYEVSREMLMRYQGSLLANLANTWNEDKFNSEIFIFRDGQLFAYVLDYLRSGKVHLPYSITLAALKKELDYFQIPVDMSQLIVEKDYFSIDRLSREIKAHKAAIQEKEMEIAAIVESYRLAYELTTSVMEKGFDWSSVLSPSLIVKPGINKEMLHDSLLSQGIDVYGYNMGNFKVRVALGPVQEEEKGAYCQTPTASPFRFF